MSPQRICVTGGAGFIGGHLVARLLAEGAQVVVLDNLSTGRRENVPGGAELLVGDVTEPATCSQAIGGCDAVIHLAARVAIRSSFEFVVEDTLVNICGTAVAVRAAAQAGTVRRFVSASSMAVYADAPSPFPISEEHCVRPVSPYGISKLAAEQLVHSVAAAAGMESVVLRLFNTYGRGQLFSPYVGVVTIFVNQLRKGTAPTIFGDGEQARDFVHVDDVAGAFCQALWQDVKSGESFNIGTGFATSVNRLYRTVAGIMGSTLQPVHADPAPGELRYSIAAIDKARRLLHYAPAYRFETGIAEVIHEILENSRESAHG